MRTIRAPARSEDTWIHHVLLGGNIEKKTATLTSKYIEGRLQKSREICSRDAERGWEAEISGRSLSLAFDIEPFAHACASKIQGGGFRGVAFATASAIREHENFNFFLDRTCQDPAHALLVVISLSSPPSDIPNQKISHLLVRSLVKLLQVVLPDNLSELSALRRRAAP